MKQHINDAASEVFGGKSKDAQNPADSEKAQFKKVIGDITVVNTLLKKLKIKD